MHICLIIYSTHENKDLELNIGGVANQVLQQLPEFEKIEDIKISILTKYSEYRPLTNNVKIYTLHKYKNSKLDTFYFFMKSFLKIVKINKRDKIDFINIHSYNYNIIVPILLRICLGIPIFIKTPTDYETSQREILLLSKFSNLISSLWMIIFKRKIIKLGKIYIQAINDKIYKDFIGWGFPSKDIIKISNGISSGHFLNLEKKKRNAIHFGFIGRLLRSKNIKFMLKIYALYAKTYPDDRLFIFGKGPEENFIKNFIEENNLSSMIKYQGFVNKFEIYPSIDVLIHPSLGEGVPNTVLEAMLTDTLVIASNVSGNRDLVKHRTTGLLFDPFKEEELLEQLFFFKENPVIITDFLKRAKKDIISNFEIGIIVSKIYKFLKSKS